MVRRGRVNVEEEDPDTGETRTLRTLERGASFGEIGLLETTMRRASVVAATNTELFEVNKSAFERLLADSIDAPTFAPTMQAYAELRELTPFRTASIDALSVLLEHGSWRSYPPGEAIVSEGERGDAFYAIGSGQVEVERGGGSRGDPRSRRPFRRAGAAARRAEERERHHDRADPRVPSRPPWLRGGRGREPPRRDRTSRRANDGALGGSVDCWHCRRNAVGTCRFCGRGVCEDHAQTQPFVLQLLSGNGPTRALGRRGRAVLRRVLAASGPDRPPGARRVTYVTAAGAPPSQRLL